MYGSSLDSLRESGPVQHVRTLDPLNPRTLSIYGSPTLLEMM